ncbi:hypothetical protein AB0L05_02240 [Nonomuraea pusilla]|uniref:hypothetical protein n=1 Tax=Nonomuraea pusilla TaxID=46177 RepID=UPI00331A0743
MTDSFLVAVAEGCLLGAVAARWVTDSFLVAVAEGCFLVGRLGGGCGIAALHPAWQVIHRFSDDGVFSRWMGVCGVPQFLGWGIGLFAAAWSYRARTA